MDVCKCRERESKREKEGGEVEQANERDWEREREAAHECNRAVEERKERERRRTRRYARSFTSCLRDARTAAERLPFLSFFFHASALCCGELFILSSVSEVTSLCKTNHYLLSLLATCSTFFFFYIYLLLFTAFIDFGSHFTDVDVRKSRSTYVGFLSLCKAALMLKWKPPEFTVVRACSCAWCRRCRVMRYWFLIVWSMLYALCWDWAGSPVLRVDPWGEQLPSGYGMVP